MAMQLGAGEQLDAATPWILGIEPMSIGKDIVPIHRETGRI